MPVLELGFLRSYGFETDLSAGLVVVVVVVVVGGLVVSVAAPEVEPGQVAVGAPGA